MTSAEWIELYLADKEAYRKAYVHFMYDEPNPTCYTCPEACGSRPLPCGQQKCWVDCHRGE